MPAFAFLYELKFEEARNQFEAWRSLTRRPPGSASEAASYLFEECYRQGVLTSEFFVTTNVLWGRRLSNPTRNCAPHFSQPTTGTRLGATTIEGESKDANALLAMTLSVGMQATMRVLSISSSWPA